MGQPSTLPAGHRRRIGLPLLAQAHRFGGADCLRTRRPVAYIERAGRELAEDDVAEEA